MNKKAGVPIAIVLLVLAVLALATFTIFSFISGQNKMKSKIYTGNFLSEVYSKEKIINSYVQDIAEKSAESISTKEEFISNFAEEIEDYRHENGEYFAGELIQIKSQLVSENIEVANKKVTAVFEISIQNSFEDKGKQIALAEYKYTKVFEADT